MINNKEQQEKEVKRWWNYPRNLRWDTFYDESNPDRHHVIERQKKTLERVDALNLPNGAKILELGYGGGQTIKLLLERGYEVHGIDVSDQLCEKAIDRCIEYVKSKKAYIKVGSIEERYEYKDNFFDAVIVCGALQYLNDIDICVQEVHRVLKPNSHFIVCQTNMYAIKDMVYPRRLLLRLMYAITGQKTELFPSFRSMMLDNDLFGKSFKKYETFFLKYKFLSNGDEKLNFSFKKRLNSYWRLKKNLMNNKFIITHKTGATFFFPPDNIFNKLVSILNSVLQFISDYILRFIFVFADNVIITARKIK